jgi:glc operon protein GlcG
MATRLDLVRARSAADAALAQAALHGLLISVAVVDAEGHDVITVRADGASWFTADVARAKARTASAFDRESSDLAALKSTFPELMELIAVQLPFRVTSLPGGVPLRRHGTLVGAVGVSGAQPDQDLDCAKAAASLVSENDSTDAGQAE